MLKIDSIKGFRLGTSRVFLARELHGKVCHVPCTVLSPPVTFNLGGGKVNPRVLRGYKPSQYIPIAGF
jgi:hypothetical protein